MSKVPRNLRNNIISYVAYLAGNTPGKKEQYDRNLIMYLQQNASSSYNKNNLDDIKSINSQLAIAIKKSRYDDLFEDFVKSGYINPRELDGEDSLRESLKNSMDKNPNLKKYEQRTPRKYNGLIRQFIDGMINTEDGQKIISKGQRAVLISDSTIDDYRKKVKESQQEKFERLVRENKAVAIFDKKTKQERVVYADKNKYRDLNSGRFAKRPKQLQLR